MRYLYFYMRFVKISLSLELFCENPYDVGWKVNFGENDVKKAENRKKIIFLIFGISRRENGLSHRKNGSVGFGVFTFKTSAARWSRSSRISLEISFPFKQSSQIKEKIRDIFLRAAKCVSRREVLPTCCHINSAFHSSVQHSLNFKHSDVQRNSEACSTSLWTDILGAL